MKYRALRVAGGPWRLHHPGTHELADDPREDGEDGENGENGRAADGNSDSGCALRTLPASSGMPAGVLGLASLGLILSRRGMARKPRR